MNLELAKKLNEMSVFEVAEILNQIEMMDRDAFELLKEVLEDII
jgi:hypothetical protein